MSLKFTCPSCQCNDLEVVETGVVISSQIIDIDDEEGFFEYDILETNGGCVDRYQCYRCGWILKNDQGEPITTEDEIVAWVKKYCSQDDEG